MAWGSKRDQQDGTWRSEDVEYKNRLWARPDQKTTPMKCERRTTDTGCLVAFVISMIALAVVLIYAMIHGNLSLYFGFTDDSGNTCGSDKKVQEPYMYMCQDERGGLDVDHPNCVARCPTSANTETYCAGTRGLTNVADYPTKPFSGKLCMPVDPKLKAVVTAKISAAPGIRFFLVVSEVLEGIWPIIFASVLALLLGFANLFLLRRYGLCFAWFGFFAMIGVPLILGMKLLHASSHGGVENVLVLDSEKGARVAGLFFLGLSISLGCLVACEWRDLLVAKVTTKAAAECILDTVPLLVQPFIALLIHVLAFVGLAAGFLLLTTCQGWRWEGLVLSWPLLVFMVLYVLASLWCLQTVNAMSIFVASYVTEEWFFAGYNTRFFSKEVDEHTTGSAIADGAKYHMGTFALGAIVLPLTRGPRAVLAHLMDASERENGLGRCVRAVFGCFIDFYQKHLERLNRCIYMDTALNGLPFQPASVHALEVISDEATDVLSMHGAVWMIELACAGGITSICVAVTHLLCTLIPPFNTPTSYYYVADPVLVDVTVAFCCCWIALDFLQIVVVVSDCLLFCCAVDAIRNPISHAMREAGSLLSHMNVCASERSQPDKAEKEDPKHLPHTRNLLIMVTNMREEQQEEAAQKDSGSCCDGRRG